MENYKFSNRVLANRLNTVKHNYEYLASISHDKWQINTFLDRAKYLSNLIYKLKFKSNCINPLT